MKKVAKHTTATRANKRRNAKLNAKTKETLDRLALYYLTGVWNGKIHDGA